MEDQAEQVQDRDEVQIAVRCPTCGHVVEADANGQIQGGTFMAHLPCDKDALRAALSQAVTFLKEMI